MTHRFQNNYTKEFLAKLRKFYGLQQISQPEDLAKGLRIPREFDFRGQRDLITVLKQDWGNRPLEGTNKTLCAPGPRRKKQLPQKRLGQRIQEVKTLFTTTLNLTSMLSYVLSAHRSSPETGYVTSEL